MSCGAFCILPIASWASAKVRDIRESTTLSTQTRRSPRPEACGVLQTGVLSQVFMPFCEHAHNTATCSLLLQHTKPSPTTMFISRTGFRLCGEPETLAMRDKRILNSSFQRFHAEIGAKKALLQTCEPEPPFHVAGVGRHVSLSTHVRYLPGCFLGQGHGRSRLNGPCPPIFRNPWLVPQSSRKISPRTGIVEQAGPDLLSFSTLPNRPSRPPTNVTWRQARWLTAGLYC